MLELIIAFVIGMFAGVIGLAAICCAIASSKNDRPLDKEDWKELP